MRRLLFVIAVAVVGVVCLRAIAQEKDSPAAAATRKKLKAKISVEYKDTRMEDIKKDLAEKVRDATESELSIVLDNVGGVSNNMTVTYKADDKPLEVILDEMFKKNDMGYIVISKEYKNYKGRYDGWLLIVKGKERGYPAGQGPGKTAGKGTAKSKDKPAAKKEKEEAKDKAEDADAKAEQRAAGKLKLAQTLLEDGKKARAKERLQEIVKDYPKTKAAAEAKKLLEDLEK